MRTTKESTNRYEDVARSLLPVIVERRISIVDHETLFDPIKVLSEELVERHVIYDDPIPEHFHRYEPFHLDDLADHALEVRRDLMGFGYDEQLELIVLRSMAALRLNQLILLCQINSEVGSYRAENLEPTTSPLQTPLWPWPQQ